MTFVGARRASPSSERKRAVAWVKEEPFAVEFAEVELTARHLAATGVAIGTEPVPYRGSDAGSRSPQLPPPVRGGLGWGDQTVPTAYLFLGDGGGRVFREARQVPATPPCEKRFGSS
jgi:hypothetical protein